MIVTLPFAKRLRRMRFRTANDAPFLGVVVRTRPGRREPRACAAIFIGVHEFVSESERRRLTTAIRRTERAMRVPLDDVGSWIEVIVVVGILADRVARRTILEIVEGTVHDRVAGIERTLDGDGTVVDEGVRASQTRIVELRHIRTLIDHAGSIATNAGIGKDVNGAIGGRIETRIELRPDRCKRLATRFTKARFGKPVRTAQVRAARQTPSVERAFEATSRNVP